MLKNDQIFLRALEPTDLDLVFEWENDTRLWQFGAAMAPFSRHQIWEYLRDYTADIYAQKQLRLMICRTADADAVGMIDLFDFDPLHKRAQIGLLVDSKYQRRKFGTQAVALIAEYSRDMLDLHQIAVYISADNVPSLSLFKKMGFEQTAILKDWCHTPTGYVDQILLQLILK